MRFRNAATLALILFFNSVASGAAIESGTVLPNGIWHPRYIYGVMEEAGESFGAEGELYTLRDQYSQSFDAQTLSGLSPEVASLISFLNVHAQQTGNQLHLGSLEFQGAPTITYHVPMLAKGINSRWTIGAALPIVNYRADMSVVHTGGNNVQEIEDGLGNTSYIDPALQAGLAQLRDLDLEQEFYATLAAKGYKPIRRVDESFMGDMQVFSLFRLVEGEHYSITNKLVFNLPTGPKDDPDDLLDPSSFHETAVHLSLINEYKPFGNYSLYFNLVGGYRLTLPDKTEARVPMDEFDQLPNADRKETLDRNLGDSLLVEVSTFYQPTKFLELGIGHETGVKATDEYDGNRPAYNYNLLSQNSDSTWQKLLLETTFSTVQMYYAKSFPVPFQVTLGYSNMYAGINVTRSVVYEMTLKMYF